MKKYFLFKKSNHQHSGPRDSQLTNFSAFFLFSMSFVFRLLPLYQDIDGALTFSLFLFSYLISSALLSIPLLYLNQKGSILYGLFLFFISPLNLEHIFINNGHLNFRLFNIINDPIFFESLINFSLFKNFLYSLTILSTCFLIFTKIQINFSRNLLAEIFLPLFILDVFLPKNISLPEWQQDSLLSSYAKILISKNHEIKFGFPQGNDVDSNSLKITKKRNVYLFVLESFSQDYLDMGIAKNLKKLQEKGQNFNQFITNQQQTNRGLFSIFCGQFPNLFNTEAKADILIGSPAPSQFSRGCFPNILKENGYKNFFLQSAPLSFMSKEEFAKAVGFDYAIGAEGYPTAKIIGPWGVDDQTSLETLVTLSKKNQTPFFVSFLSISTHYPYKTNQSSHNLKYAIEYTDKVVSYAIKEIQKTDPEGLIIVTSDESRPLTSSVPLLRSNRGLLFFLDKNLTPHTFESAFSLVNISNILIEILSSKKISINNNPIYFGNIYTNRFYRLSPENRLTSCNKQFQCVEHKIEGNVFGRKTYLGRSDDQQINTMKTFISHNDWTHSINIFESQNIELKKGLPKEVFQEFKLNGRIKRIKVTLQFEYPIKVILQNYECGNPSSLKIIEKQFTSDQRESEFDLSRNSTHCVSLYLNTTHFQKIPRILVTKSEKQ